MLSHPSLTREDQLTSHYNMMRSNAFKKSDTQNRSTTTKTWLSLYTLLWLAHPLLISVSTHQQFWKRESLFILYEKNWLNKEIYLLYLYLVVVIYDSKNNSHFFFDAKHLIYSIIIQILGQSEMGLIHILAKNTSCVE